MFCWRDQIQFSVAIVVLCPPYGGFFQFYLIIGHKHLIWFIFVGTAATTAAAGTAASTVESGRVG